MINFNGQLTEQSHQIENNRGFLYGDSVFESIRIIEGKICFWEKWHHVFKKNVSRSFFAEKFMTRESICGPFPPSGLPLGGIWHRFIRRMLKVWFPKK